MKAEYIAGFFDGEGNINKVKVKGYPQYQIRMYQAGKEGLKLLKEIQNFLGYGNIYEGKKNTRKKNWAVVWELTITSKREILDFKDRIGWFCKIKKFPDNKDLIDKRIKVFG